MRRFVILSCLYFAQGLPFGFFSHAVPVLLNRSHPPEIAGLSSLLAIPWAFKFLLGPLIDKLGPGRRKLAIVPMQLLTLSTLIVVGLLDISEARLTPMLIGFFLVSVFSAVQDVATDALSIDVLSPSEYGSGAGIQYGAYRAGMIIGGGGVLAMVDHMGYREGFFLMASSIALASIRTTGSKLNHATTLFDYIRRAMPLNAPQSLTDDQVYAVVAYLLSVDDIIPVGTVMDQTTLLEVEMPNRDGFVNWWPEPAPAAPN